MDATTSLSARRAWIEILYTAICKHLLFVALRKESVDRNKLISKARPPVGVALRKESVDRNIAVISLIYQQAKVALRKESVDRNPPAHGNFRNWCSRSPQGERG